MLMTIAFVALAVAQSASGASIAIGVAIVAVGVLLGARNASRSIHGREITVGGRARAHKESLAGMASPRHPGTPGRPLSRAPGRALSAA